MFHLYQSMRTFVFAIVIAALLLAGCAQATTAPPSNLAQPTNTTAPTEPPLPTLTSTPNPTSTPLPPTATPVPPTATPVPTNTPIPPTPTPDMQAVISSANILLFEDMVSWGYIKKGLDEAGVEVTFVGDRIGTFKNEITSDRKWDLIIAAAEGRGGVQGEFFDYLKDQLDQGASVILELWTLDSNAKGRLEPILKECGVEFQANWINPSNRGVYWVDPSHPIASSPNEVNMEKFTNYWKGDVGDLVKKVPGSEAQIIASANQANPEMDGLITVCYSGRLILQTFSTHDHPEKEAMLLWQNYVNYALKMRVEQGLQ